MTLNVSISGWWAGNAKWITYDCDECGESLHVIESQPAPACCPFCGGEA